ncbi:hypothetical protein WS9_010030 [Paraclostridium sordellii 8483]|uniref:hypothetical protein n=1 Tax=Paraclostridium sordellii TaxID=1505 RepID=UPI0002D975BE|nr:hypothetical protein [Paeniclostridium sordellii]TAN66642.1 hypothetical protein WS9_010030 [Paeniclostridium sordellii 8483]
MINTEKEAVNLAERIITLNPENKKIMKDILNQFLISEAAIKLGVRPIDVKSILEAKEKN